VVADVNDDRLACAAIPLPTDDTTHAGGLLNPAPDMDNAYTPALARLVNVTDMVPVCGVQPPVVQEN
jgi:hypothetical protein